MFPSFRVVPAGQLGVGGPFLTNDASALPALPAATSNTFPQSDSNLAYPLYIAGITIGERSEEACAAEGEQ